MLELVAHDAARVDYERALFSALDSLIGFDVAFCVRAQGLGPHTPGLDAAVKRRTDAQLDVYATELHALKVAAMQDGGVAVDREVLGAAQLERTRTYREVMRPHRGRCTLLTYLGPAHAPVGLLVLGRSGSDFGAHDLQCMRQARALFTVCERSLPGHASAGPALTARERELLSYLRLGYSNPQIAAACGTSFRTVRNQLTQLFGKLEVATRAEAVARSYQLMLAL